MNGNGGSNGESWAPLGSNTASEGVGGWKEEEGKEEEEEVGVKE